MDNPAVKLIKTMRKSQLMSVRRLARESGLSAAYVSQIESGTRPLTPRATTKIADALRIPPYALLSEAGFIPAEHVEKARAMVTRAENETPEMLGKRDFDWAVADYLFALGDDPYGTGLQYGPVPPSLDWRQLDPEAPAPMLDVARQWATEQAAKQKREVPPIEGWDELSDADRTFVQQMVNKLRRSATGE